MTFELNDTEKATLETWLKEHDCSTEDRYPRSYIFTPTGIGHNIKVTCKCGAVKDITDYGCW